MCLAATVLAIALLPPPAVVHAKPIKVRYPEGPAHGFMVVSDMAGTVLAHGELVQWLEGRIVANRMVIRFEDDSVYDETVRFSQQPVFRLVSYKLVQQGPSFAQSSDIQFDRSGRYKVRLRAAADQKEQRASGKFDVPDDLTNGITSTILKNLAPGSSATTHLVAFDPQPRVLQLHLTPEGSDRYWVGRTAESATRFLIQPEVTGLTGVLATMIGKQPPALRMWIAQGRAPTMVRFEGFLYMGGPSWRIELSAPRWER